MICPNCNSYVSAEWDFCKSCGKPLDKHLRGKVCPKCGVKNFEYAMNCEACDAPFIPVEREPVERRSIWDSWLGIGMATAIILLTLLFLYLVLMS